MISMKDPKLILVGFNWVNELLIGQANYNIKNINFIWYDFIVSIGDSKLTYHDLVGWVKHKILTRLVCGVGSPHNMHTYLSANGMKL